MKRINNTTRLWQIFGAVWLGSMLICCCAAVSTDTPTVDFVVGALAYQNTATVDCVLTGELINSPAFNDVVDTSVAKVKPTTSWQAKYVRTPGALYMKLNGVERSSARSGLTDFLDYRQRVERDGKQFGSIRTYRISDKWGGMSRLETILFPVYPRSDDPSTQFLYGWVKYAQISPVKDQIDGQDCFRLDITDTGNSIAKHYVMWLDPAIGFCPRRFTASGSDVSTGDFTVTVDSVDYREIAPGIWYPAQQTVTFNAPKRKMVDAKAVMKVSDLTGDKHYSNADLLLIFKSGAELSLHTAKGVSTKIVQP